MFAARYLLHYDILLADRGPVPEINGLFWLERVTGPQISVVGRGVPTPVSVLQIVGCSSDVCHILMSPYFIKVLCAGTGLIITSQKLSA